MNKTIDDYRNLVELLKQALSFYGNESNYNGVIYKNLETTEPLIKIDRGSQAKFALGKINSFENEENDEEQEFVKNIMASIENGESQEDVLDMVKKFKEQTEQKEKNEG